MTLRMRVVLILGTASVVVVAFVAGLVAAPSPKFPTDTSSEAGFARDMQAHHLQAVELSMVMRDRTDDEELRLLAYDIALTQQQQAGQMYSWLTVWGLPQAASEPSMTWVISTAPTSASHEYGGGSDHVPGAPMPGLATTAQLDDLKASSGILAEILYLRLMIAHHKGGVEMAEALLERSENRIVVNFAVNIVAAQQSEIDYMTKLLAVRAG